MKKVICGMLVASLLGTSVGCATHQGQGAGVGATVGGIAGALLDHRNPWRGGVIGAVLGGVAGASFADISARAPQEAARHWKPVEYRSDDERAVYRAEPVSVDSYTKCKKVRERIWEDGRLIKDEVREVCRGESSQPGY